METLVDGCHAQEPRGGASRGSGTLPVPVHGGNVICVVLHSALTDVKTLGSSFLVNEATGKF